MVDKANELNAVPSRLTARCVYIVGRSTTFSARMRSISTMSSSSACAWGGCCGLMMGRFPGWTIYSRLVPSYGCALGDMAPVLFLPHRTC